MPKLIFLSIAILFLSAACGGRPGDDPAAAVEAYLQAKVRGDREQIRQLLCLQMEAELEREARTFEAVSDVAIQDMACRQVEGSPVVRCQGKIVASYGAEQTEFPLVSYRVVKEDGEWRWCGEAP